MDEIVVEVDEGIRLRILRRETARGSRLVVEVGESAAGAVAIARTFDGRIALVQQDRPAVGTVLWELPRGLVEPGEDLVRAACRELTEETGLQCGPARLLGTVWPDSGILTTSVGVVEVQIDDEVPRTAPDGEVDALRWVADGELAHLIRTGELRDGISLAAVALAAHAD